MAELLKFRKDISESLSKIKLNTFNIKDIDIDSCGVSYDGKKFEKNALTKISKHFNLKKNFLTKLVPD
jgi:hypothetical protein